jgi:hypothetical protein
LVQFSFKLITHMLTPYLLIASYLISWIFAIGNACNAKARHRRAWGVSVVLLSIGLSMLGAFHLIGSSVDEKGVLREAFPLIALGSLICVAGVGMTLLLGLWNLLRRIASHWSK